MAADGKANAASSKSSSGSDSARRLGAAREEIRGAIETRNASELLIARANQPAPAALLLVQRAAWWWAGAGARH